MQINLSQHELTLPCSELNSENHIEFSCRSEAGLLESETTPEPIQQLIRDAVAGLEGMYAGGLISCAKHEATLTEKASGVYSLVVEVSLI